MTCKKKKKTICQLLQKLSDLSWVTITTMTQRWINFFSKKDTSGIATPINFRTDINCISACSSCLVAFFYAMRIRGGWRRHCIFQEPVRWSSSWSNPPGTNQIKEENLILMYISLWNVLLDALNVLFCDTYTLLFSVYLFDWSLQLHFQPSMYD